MDNMSALDQGLGGSNPHSAIKLIVLSLVTNLHPNNISEGCCEGTVVRRPERKNETLDLFKSQKHTCLLI